jgi:hypothetical protein
MAFAEPLPESAGPPRTRDRRHADHRSCRRRGELARAGAQAPHRRMRRRGQGQRLRARPRTGHRKARQGRLQDVFRGRSCRSAARARPRARGDDLRAQRICARGGEAFAEINARPVINSMTELAEWDAFVAAQNWRGGAALHVDTGMNRLGISPRKPRACAARAERESRHHAVDEPPRLRRNPRSPAQCQPNPALSRAAHALPRHSGLARQFLRHLPRRFGAFRSGKTGRRALRHQSHARPRQSDARRRIDRAHPASPQVARRDRRLWRHVDGKRASRIAVAALGYADGCCARKRHRRKPGGAAIVAGKRCPIVGRISMDLVCIDITDLPDGRSTAATSRPSSARISRSTRLPHPPAPSATRSSRGSGCVAISSIVAVEANRECEMKWPRAHKTSSARAAARPTRAGPAAAKPAANGTRWSRKAPRRPARSSRKGPAFRHRAAQRRDARSAAPCLRHCRIRPRDRRRPGARLGAAARRRSRHRQIDAAARSRGRLRARGHRAVYISGEEAVAQVRLRAERLGLTDAPSNSPPKPRSRTSWRRCRRRAPRLWSSIRSRPCGRKPSSRRPARSRRCADRRAS